MGNLHQIHTQLIEEIYDRYKIPLYRVIQKYIGQKDAVDDVFQEVIIKIIKKIDLLSTLAQPKLEAYIYLIARGVSIDYLRKFYKDDLILIENDTVFDILNSVNNSAVSQLNSVGKIELIVMMEKIPADDKILLIGKYYFKFSIKEIADMVGCTPTAVRTRICRARKRLLDEWLKAGLKMEDFINEK